MTANWTASVNVWLWHEPSSLPHKPLKYTFSSRTNSTNCSHNFISAPRIKCVETGTQCAAATNIYDQQRQIGCTQRVSLRSFSHTTNLIKIWQSNDDAGTVAVAAATTDNDINNDNDGERGRGKRGEKTPTRNLLKSCNIHFLSFVSIFNFFFLSILALCAVETNLFLNNFSRATEIRRHYHRQLVDQKMNFKSESSEDLRMQRATTEQISFIRIVCVCVHLQKTYQTHGVIRLCLSILNHSRI